MSEWEAFTADDGEPGIRSKNASNQSGGSFGYPLSEYSIGPWNVLTGLRVATSDLPAPTSDELSWQTSDSLEQD